MKNRSLLIIAMTVFFNLLLSTGAKSNESRLAAQFNIMIEKCSNPVFYFIEKEKLGKIFLEELEKSVKNSKLKTNLGQYFWPELMPPEFPGEKYFKDLNLKLDQIEKSIKDGTYQEKRNRDLFNKWFHSIDYSYNGNLPEFETKLVICYQKLTKF